MRRARHFDVPDHVFAIGGKPELPKQDRRHLRRRREHRLGEARGLGGVAFVLDPDRSIANAILLIRLTMLSPAPACSSCLLAFVSFFGEVLFVELVFLVAILS